MPVTISLCTGTQKKDRLDGGVLAHPAVPNAAGGVGARSGGSRRVFLSLLMGGGSLNLLMSGPVCSPVQREAALWYARVVADMHPLITARSIWGFTVSPTRLIGEVSQ